MTELETQLSELEAQMVYLCTLRADRVAIAEAAIKRANKDFDRDCLPLGRKINELREQIAKETPDTTETPVHRVTRKHDPEWSQDDIDHFYELRQREARNGR